jgi:hypothetical protein
MFLSFKAAVMFFFYDCFDCDQQGFGFGFPPFLIGFVAFFAIVITSLFSHFINQIIEPATLDVAFKNIIELPCVQVANLIIPDTSDP